MKKIFTLILITLLVACATNNKKAETVLPEPELYDLAYKDFEAKNYKPALENFAKFVNEYPYSDKAQKAQLMEVVCKYKLKDYSGAEISVNEYLNLYPVGQDTEYAYYLRAVIFYDQINHPRFDQYSTEKAKEVLTEFIYRYSGSEYINEVRMKLDLVNDHLASHDLYVGRFYLNAKNIDAAINRFKSVVENYQTTTSIEEALYRLTECYLILGLKSEAMKYGSILAANYPGSKWYQMSYQLLSK